MSQAAETALDTRERILRVALELIRTRSYLGFSFQDVAEQIGIRKASLYHHFPTKEALGIEVLERATEWFKVWAERTPATPQKKLGAYVRMFRDTLQAGSAVCPAGAFAPGWDCIEVDLQKAVRALRSTHIAWLTDVLTELGSPKQARQRANQLFALCQGALLASRMTGDPADFDEALAPAKAALGF